MSTVSPSKTCVMPAVKDMPSSAPRQDLNRSGQPSATGEGEKLRSQRARADRTISLEDIVSDLISDVLNVRQCLLPNIL
jgi:hypothetical protein